VSGQLKKHLYITWGETEAQSHPGPCLRVRNDPRTQLFPEGEHWGLSPTSKVPEVPLHFPVSRSGRDRPFTRVSSPLKKVTVLQGCLSTSGRELLSQDQDNACFEIQSFEFLTGVVFQHTLPTLLFTTKFLIK
jgi:hypothetical protein